MNPATIYILIAIIGLALITVALFLLRKKKKEKFTPLTGLAFAFIISGMIFDSRIIAYSLMGMGIALAITDMILKLKKKEVKSLKNR